MTPASTIGAMLEAMVADHLLREGIVSGGAVLSSPDGAALVDVDVYREIDTVAAALRAAMLDPALAWCAGEASNSRVFARSAAVLWGVQHVARGRKTQIMGAGCDVSRARWRARCGRSSAWSSCDRGVVPMQRSLQGA